MSIVVDSGDQCIRGVIDTNGNFMTGVDTGHK